MPLSSQVLGGLIDEALAGSGARGPNRNRFSYAFAKGVVDHFVGKNFKTQDTGDGLGGTGQGVGIMSLNSQNMAGIALDTMSSRGPYASKFWNAIMSAVKTHLESATKLSTVNPAVGTGTGQVIIGSFTVNISGLKAAIDDALLADGARGPNRSNLALAAATGIVTDVLATGTGTVTISGPVMPPGTSGIGNGTIS